MQLIKLLIIYLPFEEFILKWLPVSDQIYQWLRQLPDILILCFFITIIFVKLALSKGFSIIGKKVDVFLCLFVIWSFLTLAMNPSADIFLAMLNIKALLRYIPLIYILLILNPSYHQIDSLIRWIAISVVCQVAIGFFQLFGGITARDFLSARHVSEGIGGIIKDFTGDRFEGVNDLMGTMGDTLSFALFLLVGLNIFIFSSRINTLKYWCGIVILFFLIYLSGSRAATIAVLLSVIFSQLWIKRDKMTLKLVVILFVPLLIVTFSTFDFSDVDDNKSFLYIFNGNYIEAALNQRLGLIVYISPNLISEIHSLIGFSPDKFVFIDFVDAEMPNVPFMLLAVLSGVIEDVYWFAIYVYYGLIGIILWLLFLFFLMKIIYISINKAVSIENYRVSCIAFFLLLISLPLNFLNQSFEVRSFSFYLWLFCGLALVSWRKSQIINNIGK